MGGKSYRVGEYQLVIMDYNLEELPEEGSKNSQDYDRLMIPCVIDKVGTKKEKNISVPCSDLYTIKLFEDGNYAIDWEAPGPRDWLFNALVSKGVEIKVEARLPIHLGFDGDYKEVPKLYLRSEIFDENIEVTKFRREYTITSLAELEWLGKRGFRYD